MKNDKTFYQAKKRKIHFNDYIDVRCFKKDEEVTIMSEKLSTEEIINEK